MGTLAPALQPLAGRLIEQGTKAGLMALLKSVVKRGTARRLVKYVPIAGQAVAATAAYVFTSAAIESYTNECHELASGILDVELSQGPEGAR